ncbi:MAG: secretin N-terminal domain-containing protein [Planctomycetota bacterium]
MELHKIQSRLCVAIVLLCWISPNTALAQLTFGDSPPSGNQGSVELNFQGPIKLDALINYLSTRIGTKFEYSAAVANRQVSLRAVGPVPVSSLPALLSSVLRTEGLAIANSDVPGWKRIVDVKKMSQFAPIGEAPAMLQRDGTAAPVTQVFVLENASVSSLATVLKPFMTESGSNLIALSDTNVLIVTDYAATVKTVADLIKIIDQPGAESVIDIYQVQNTDAESLAEQVKEILGDQTDNRSGPIRIIPQSQSNRVALAGRSGIVRKAMDLLRQMDVSRSMSTKVYRIKHTTAERVDKLAKGFIQPQDAKTGYQSTVDEEGNLIVVRATAEVHSQLRQLIDEIDVTVDSSESPIQFYKLKNASAINVLYSLLALQEAYGQGNLSAVSPAAFTSPLGGVAVPNFGGFSGGLPGQGMNGFGNQNTGLQTTRLPLTPGMNGAGDAESFLPETNNPLARPTLADGSGFGQGGFNGLGQAGQLAGGGVASLPGGARVSADISTNSLIVFAPANVQEMYAKLIRSLDQRRPQVLIEAKVIAVDTSDDFSLGVEVSIGDRQGSKRLFKFTSFGLSEVDPTTGALTIIPGLGFNGTLVDPDVADVVVRALSSHQRARVLAAPKILVNDNSTGKLESVSSVPFSSVNASQTVSTTSLGGDQQAGTIITATPHINENDHLQLDFDVEFSTFSGTATAGLPPPRQIDRVGSSVTIPDGKTVVVGGLKRVSDSDTFNGLPWAEKIPVLRELTSRTDRSHQTTSFFLFIRPLILRDSQFSDLRFLSDKQVQANGLSGDYPISRPELIP